MTQTSVGSAKLVLVAFAAVATVGCVPEEPATSTTTTLSTTTSSTSSSSTSTTIVGGGRARTFVDRPDATELPQVKALYVLPADGIDRQFDVNGRIATSLAANAAWSDAEAGASLRYDTYEGEADVAFLQLTSTAAEVALESSPLTSLVPAAQAAGFDDPSKTYVMFYEGDRPGACGSAYRPGSYAGVYLLTQNCQELGLTSSPEAMSWMDFTAIHEVFHSLGASPDCAPNMSSSGHVGDNPADLMYSGALPRPLPRVLDSGRDDYWGHPQTGCVDVSQSAFLEPLPVAALRRGAVSAPPVPGPIVISEPPAN